jgi:hypothetical protein
MYTFGIGSNSSSSSSSKNGEVTVTDRPRYELDKLAILPTGVKTCLFYRKSKPTPLSTQPHMQRILRSSSGGKTAGA